LAFGTVLAASASVGEILILLPHRRHKTENRYICPQRSIFVGLGWALGFGVGVGMNLYLFSAMRHITAPNFNFKLKDKNNFFIRDYEF